MNQILDLHVDSIIQQRLFGYRVTRRHRSKLRGQPLFWHADVPRMREARYAGACLGVHYWPWESERGWAEMNRQIDYLDQVVGADADVLRVREPGDWERARREEKLALAPGVEGAHMLNGQLERVEALAERGVAYLTLTHFSRNAAASPSIGRGANGREGLTDFGKELVVALQEVGVAVDLAHVNTPGVLDACAVATGPVLCTHTGAKALHDHRRNITDEEIDAIAGTGGVIGIIFAPTYLTGRLVADSSCVVEHALHIIDRVGVGHVGLGSDYDGWLPSIPSDHRDCRDLHRVLEGLRAAGLAQAALDAIAGGNARRVLSGVKA